MTKFFSILFFASLIFSSCNESAAPEAALQPDISPTDSLITVNQNVFQFTCVVPKDVLAANAADIQFNDATGQLEIHIGEGFGLIVQEGKPNLGFIKKDLEEDLMWKNTVVVSEESRLVYKRALPDGSTELMQFIQHVKVAGKDYAVRTLAVGTFNVQEVAVMRKVVDSIK